MVIVIRFRLAGRRFRYFRALPSGRCDPVSVNTSTSILLGKGKAATGFFGTLGRSA